MYVNITRSQIQLVIKNYYILQILGNAADGGGDDGGEGDSAGIHRPLYDILITL